MLTVDLDAIAANWRLLAQHAAPGECAGVVKADAYGLGAVPVVRRLWAAGCRTFITAHLDEAVALRPVVPDARLAVLNGLLPGTAADFSALAIRPMLNRLADIADWQAEARRLGRPLPALIHIDTAMNRLGLTPDEVLTLAAEPHRLDGITVEAWISHLASADDPASSLSEQQRQRFRAALARLPPAPASLANSAGLLRGPAFRFDLARPGCALYGVNPIPALANPLAAAIRLDGRVLQVRDVDSPQTVGYGAAHNVTRPSKIATVAVGYADGYGRRLGGVGAVYAAGRPAPVVGRISMDLMTIDVTGLPEQTVAPGRFVELIGPNRPVDRVAADAGTIGYEILTSLGRRYRRVYRGGAEA